MAPRRRPHPDDRLQFGLAAMCQPVSFIIIIITTTDGLHGTHTHCRVISKAKLLPTNEIDD